MSGGVGGTSLLIHQLFKLWRTQGFPGMINGSRRAHVDVGTEGEGKKRGGGRRRAREEVNNGAA